MKCFIVGDVHSFYNEMIKALTEAGFDKNNSDHVFISLGDLLDRGPFPDKCLEFVNSLDRKILIRGNHEDLLNTAIKRKCFSINDVYNKTYDTASIISKKTLSDFSPCDILSTVEEDPRWIEYESKLIDYAETDEYVFVHGWVPTNYSEDADEWRLGSWENARWINGMQLNSSGFNPTGKTVVCGHWHTSYGHHYLHNDGPEFNDDVFYEGTGVANFTIFRDPGIIAIDACTVYSGFVNCLVLDIDESQLKGYLQ